MGVKMRGYYFVINNETFEIEARFHEFGNPDQKWKIASISQRLVNADPKAYLTWKYEIVPYVPLGTLIIKQ